MQRGLLRLSNNFGVNFGEPKAKVVDWFEELIKAGWSSERFDRTVSYLLTHHRWPNLTLADFYAVEHTKLHGREWMIDQVGKGNKCLPYKIGDEIMYALASDDIPLPTFIAPARSYVAQEAPTCTDEQRKEILERMRSEPVKANSIGSHLGDLAERIADEH